MRERRDNGDGCLHDEGGGSEPAGRRFEGFTYDEARAVYRLLLPVDDNGKSTALYAADIIRRTGIAVENLYAMVGQLGGPSGMLCRTCGRELMENRFWYERDPAKLIEKVHAHRTKIEQLKAEAALWADLGECLCRSIREREGVDRDDDDSCEQVFRIHRGGST